MIVMIIVMLLPILAIPIFRFLTPGEAIPLYLVCCLLSGSMFWLMRNNMSRPVKTGSEALIGKETRVVSRSTSDKIAPYLVHIEGELWSASSQDSLETGDTVVIVDVEGNRLIIENAGRDESR